MGKPRMITEFEVESLEERTFVTPQEDVHTTPCISLKLEYDYDDADKALALLARAVDSVKTQVQRAREMR